MADDALPAALEKIRARRTVAEGRDGDAALWIGAMARVVGEDVPRLLAALDAVLKEHRPDDRETNWCHGCAYSWPCATVRAITRELTGEAKGG